MIEQRMPRRAAAVAFVLSALLAPTAAQAQSDEILEEVVVTGEFAGPGMWKVRHADETSGHVLWIIGDPPPLPKRLTWKSKRVEAVVRESQEILRDAAVTMQPDEKVGLLRGLTLLPAALRARKNPDATTLSALVPPDLHARWLVQKREYLGRDAGVEKWRPIFAADKLRREAIDDLKLRESGMVWEVVEKLARQHDIRITAPMLMFTIEADEIRSKLREFSREFLADLECFAVTLDYVEALSDRELGNLRAQAWATADLEALEALPALPNPGLPCVMAIMGSQVAQDVIPSDIRERLHALWIESAEKSLAANQTTFAIVPLAKLTSDGGYLARLREKGYMVEAP